MLGGTCKWAEETVWFENEPVITDWESAPAPVLDRDAAMYRLADALTEKLMAAGRDGGRFFTSITDIGGTYDILAALRGTQALLMDLYEHPAEVRAYAERLRPAWVGYFRQYAGRAIARQGGMTAWMPIWSDKPWYPLQCDFSAMISPEMFGEFILPDLRYYTEQMDRSVYHLDGPGERPHLRRLLSLPRLNAIQWTPGPGSDGAGDERWFGLYEEIQAAGKGLVLLGVRPEELEPLLRHVSAKGLYVTCRAGAGDAQELIRMADGYGVK
jgi:5-methyltetrahydrofolate--homocysteine methyltransferase